MAPAIASNGKAIAHPPGYPYPKSSPPDARVFEVYAALTWGAVMWLFNERRQTLHGGMVNSMQVHSLLTSFQALAKPYAVPLPRAPSHSQSCAPFTDMANRTRKCGMASRPSCGVRCPPPALTTALTSLQTIGSGLVVRPTLSCILQVVASPVLAPRGCSR
jgi:hypothetical protein